MDLKQFMSDPRRRNLAMLGAAAFVAVLLALGALWQQAQMGTPAYRAGAVLSRLRTPGPQTRRKSISSRKREAPSM